MNTRRDLIKLALLGGGTFGLGLAACAPEESESIAAAPIADAVQKGLDILILGGTGFIGPHMVERARERGHTVTLFNRGKTGADRFADIETLIGDRDGQLSALEGRRWDAVIDNSGYVPAPCSRFREPAD